MAEKSSVPEEGKKAPAFSLKAGSGETVKLSDLEGKPVVVYFYPKDDTPGCTIEAKGFQEHLGEFERAGAAVVGISPDGTESHCKFADKYGLTFTLLTDEDHEVAQEYGVWVEKSQQGRTYWGVQRATFLVDQAGKIAKAWPKVKPEGHAEEVLGAIRGL